MVYGRVGVIDLWSDLETIESPSALLTARSCALCCLIQA
jgi:hypothetical protein